MKKKNDRMDDGINGHWQIFSDAMIALLLIILLVNMILILYISKIPEEEFADDTYGDRYSSGANGGYFGLGTDDDEDDDLHYPYPEPVVIQNGGGGGGHYEPTTEPERPEETTVPYEYPEYRDGDKAAVYVMVIDGETQKTIREPGIEFELFDRARSQQTLRTYYPVTTEYRIFETRPEGVFYLPEKVTQGGYRLRELTEPEGYDAAEDQYFEVERYYDWGDPYVLKVPLFPSRNVIRLSMTDVDAGSPVGGGVYEVIAAEPIVTGDGTLRYASGETVDEITIDETGNGQSIELFLGRYTVRQSAVPEFYASDEKELEVKVEKKQGEQLAPLQELTCRKTAVNVTAQDALYGNAAISGAAFSLVGDSGEGEQILTTDRYGRLQVTNLNKNTRYTLRQLSSAEPYRLLDTEYVFHVDGTGRIEEEVQHSVTFANYMIRVGIGVRDVLLKNYVSDYNVTLYDGEDQVIATWNSTAMPHSMEGLEPGIYYLVINGNEKNRRTIEILDTEEVQSFDESVWTTQSLAVVASGVLAAAAIVGAVVYYLKKKTGSAA